MWGQVLKRKTIAVAMTVLLLAVSIMAVGCASNADKKEPPPSQTSKPSGTDAARKGPIKIGYGGALTGLGAEQGNRSRRGLLLAIEEANKAGGIDGRQIELVALDDRCDPKESATVADKYVSDPEVVAIVGHTSSSTTLAAAPIYNKAKLVQITCSSSSPKITDAGPYTFRVWNSDAHTVAFNVKRLLSLGYKKIGIIYENNDYGRGGYDVCIKVLQEAGIKPLAAESYIAGETKDFGTIIAKLKNAGVEAVYGAADENEIPLFLKQSHQLGFRPFFISTGTFNPAVVRLGGKEVDGAVGNAMFNPENPPPNLMSFFDRFLERFQSEGITQIDPVSPAAYEAGRMIIEALRQKGVSREAVKEYLTALKDFDTIFGPLSFDENGDTFIPMIHMVIEDGEFIEFKGK